MLDILNYNQDLSKIFSRTQIGLESVEVAVKEIIANVRANGDKALIDYTKKFDNFDITADTMLVTKQEIEDAKKQVDKKVVAALQRAKDNIVAYHKKQLLKDEVDGKTGTIFRAVEKAGIYIPGGKAAYTSSVLMCALPAVVAGVKEIIMVTPPGRYLNPLSLVAADLCGVHKIYKAGGAQAIAALAYGTETIPKVNVIAGPGNIFVTVAKKQVYGQVGIDMIAGPSEILVIADNSANPKFIAADLLSQAEHDELAQSVLITTSRDIANKVNEELVKQLTGLEKKEIAKKSLESYGAIVVCDNLTQAVELSNKIAPEHLELCVDNPKALLKGIVNAGAVFLGNYSPEPLGDYYAGTNHVLPTSGTARFSSGLNVFTFTKRISIIDYSRDDLTKVADDIISIATVEELTAHANSIRVRIEK